MVRWIYGEPLHTPIDGVEALGALEFEHTMEAIEEGQDYEVVVDFRPNGKLNVEEYYSKLEEMGTSIQLGEGDGMYRMHIHVPTEKRYEPIDYTMQLGTVTNVAIENLMAQMQAIEGKATAAQLKLNPVSAGQIAVIAVAPGDGIARVFASLGAAGIVEGGQTMNPSTQQIMGAFENLPTNKVIILPNNKNIVMAAEAAAELTVKEVRVVPSKTVPQGLAAILRLNPDGEFEGVFEEMVAALDDVQTGEITTATRSAEIDGVKVKEGQILGLLNGKLVYCSPDLKKTSLGLLEQAGMDEYELVTLFYGAGLPAGEVEAIAEAIRKSYPDHEIEIQDGGQEHYHFILSIE
jgi:hypothetical protein